MSKSTAKPPSLLGLVLRLSRTLDRRIPEVVGMPAARLALLGHLGRLKDDAEITPAALARRLRVTPSAITRTLKDLETDGLVRRRDDPKDDRRVLLRLTSGGRRELTALQDRELRFDADLMVGLPDEEHDAAIRALEHILRRIDEQGEDE